MAATRARSTAAAQAASGVTGRAAPRALPGALGGAGSPVSARAAAGCAGAGGCGPGSCAGSLGVSATDSPPVGVSTSAAGRTGAPLPGGASGERVSAGAAAPSPGPPCSVRASTTSTRLILTQPDAVRPVRSWPGGARARTLDLVARFGVWARRQGGRVGNGVRRLRAATRRDGAGQSGLASLLELSVVNAAGDALVAVALAGALFFEVPTGEARSKVALYLLITMVPFALLAPVIGPLLDRVAHGRRTALAALCLGRGLIAWQLASQLSGLAVYPLAFGLLMLSRAFGVARSAVIPRVAPAELTLVKVNSRLSLVNTVSAAVVAPIGLGIANIPHVGYPWVLRLCALLYMAGVLLAFNLPKRVDSNAGERALRDAARAEAAAAAAAAARQSNAAAPTRPTLKIRLRGWLRTAGGAPPAALPASLVLRGIVGFLTFYLAFLLRTEGGTNAWLGALAAAAAVGTGLGVLIGGRLGRRRPERLQTLALVLSVGGCLLATISYAKLTALFAALLAMLAGAMAKLALDAIIQRDIPEDIRTSAFARSETALQLAWVTGGAFGLIPMPGRLGFLLMAAAAAATMIPQARALRQASRVRRETAPTQPMPPQPMPAMMPPPAGPTVPQAWRAPGWPPGGAAPASGPGPLAGSDEADPRAVAQTETTRPLGPG
ncbi:MAG: MFS transporter, partial [Frankia sp.]|nr:MFS transporter [Frankia sp.]